MGDSLSAFNEIHALQFAWFTPEDKATKDIETTFRSVTGLDPDQVQRQRPPATPVPILVASATQSTTGTQFRIQVVPGRVDLFIEPLSNDPLQFPYFSDFGIIPESLAKAKSFCQFTGSSTVRQSFIVRLAKRLPDASAFGPEFRKILGVDYDLGGASDLVFQFNKIVRLGQYDINRVLRWAAEIAQVQQVSFAAGSQGIPAGAVVGTAHMVSYVMDINTVPNGKSFDAGGQISVLEKLGSVVQRCVAFESVGDVK
ncbi:hypothetical protein [Mesorhizobium sp. B1-1-8]|uniref:hypothetical protein n=1 Tax=Mesorhizobium sp. B1-1-8 TaxID=2589976 RepID=UPI00112B3F0A|nr:hypothetical protein [Mesorhizobium sp. B1-1-8]UCI06281.1 hypothetical protein FJ974_21030 [Mesorhizobium sp. B1-1-8]